MEALLDGRLGLAVPNEWWSSQTLLKSFEAAGFTRTQVPSPPESVLTDARACSVHAAGVRAALDGAALGTVVHAPNELLAGTPRTDRAFEGLLAYAAEIGAGHVVYHAHALPDEPSSEDRLLAETRSLSRIAARAERLEVTIAIENLAPVFPGPERLSHTPRLLRSLVNRIASERVGLCLDVGHANIVAGLRRTELSYLVKPVLDSVALFHVHDNLGGRLHSGAAAGYDPLRLDLHLAPGRGALPWDEITPLLLGHTAPILLEVHPPNLPPADDLLRETVELFGAARGAPALAA